jgi:TonB-dependent SusC/RagA subfamily outer membrane receptor
MPFDEMKQRQIPGAVSVLNADDIRSYDRVGSFTEALYGRFPGLFGSIRNRQVGNMLIVVDGIPRPATDLNVEQIDQISVVKDLSTALLYGAQAQNGVILITSKRGKPLQKMVEFTGQTGLNKPISYPKYLGSADYMTLYNEALANDGLAAKYNEEQISGTGSDNVHFPDEDYYNSTYLEKVSTFHEVVAQASGGNDIAQYYLNVGWRRNNSLLKIGEGANEHNDRLNMRGNVNYNLTDKIRILFDGMAIFTINRAPRYTSSSNDFWALSSSLRPNNTTY